MMTVQSRQTKVLFVLLVSIVLCTIVLNILGHNPPSAGAFCLSQYYSLAPVEQSINSVEVRRPRCFKWIEIYYSNDNSCRRISPNSNTLQVEQPGSLNNISGRQDFDCHFIIHNGRSGADGEIEPTESWKMQLPVAYRPDDLIRRAWQCEQTIYICIVVDNKSPQPTNIQIKRLYVLLEGLRRELSIKSGSVIYPNNWQY
jgi:hypothetical protein